MSRMCRLGTELHGPRLARVTASRFQFGWMNPSLLGFLESFRSNILFKITFGSNEFACSESIYSRRRRLVCGNLRCCFCNDPVAAPARHLVCADLYKTTTFDGQEMPGGKYLNIDDRQDSMVYIMVVDLTGNHFFTNVMYFLVNGFVGNGWR